MKKPKKPIDVYIITYKKTGKVVKMYSIEKNAIEEFNYWNKNDYYSLCKYSVVALRENDEWKETK